MFFVTVLSKALLRHAAVCLGAPKEHTFKRRMRDSAEMAERKRKVRDESRHKKGREGNKKRKPSNLKTLTRGKKEQHKKEERRRGPRLPNALRKELDLMKATEHEPSKSDEQIDFNVENNVYEYEEEIPEEESKKNNRFDHVENFEYELPDQFEDENVPSDEEDNDNEEDIDDSGKNEEGENAEEEALRHARMLQEITGLPSDAFQGKKGMNNAIITEAYPESEYNPSRDVLDGEGHISIQDLLVPLREKSGFNKLRKNIDRMKKKSTSIHAPIPKPEQERLERKAAYEHSRKDITKWEPLVKRNREAPTLYFDEDVDLGFSTVGAIASEFKPRTEFEKKIASFVNDNEVVEAHNKDGARLLEMNKISVEDVMERQNHLARMRSLLFRHEMKSKRIKKIKSKTYHRLLKKDKLKAAAQVEMDPEAAKELARKQEFKRAEERMRLRHKNSSKWAKRILERGLNAQDEGTRTALAEQLHQHALLTRKMNTMESSSSDGGSDHDDSDEDSAGSAQDGDLRLLEKAKEKTLELLEEDDEMPKSGVLALPFMVRGMKKREEAASEEAKLVLQEYEASIIQLEDKGEAGSTKADAASGRRVFGASTKQIEESSDKRRLNHDYPNIDIEDVPDIKKVNMEQNNNHCAQKDVNIDLDILREESEINHDTVFKTFDDIVKDPGCKTTYEVAIFASNSWKKKKNMPGEVTEQIERDNESKVVDTSRQDQDSEELDDSDTDSAGHMVDGILSVGPKSTYKLPSQAELIRRAFAGDDVEGDFEKDKEEVLNEENPEPEKPVLLPGWGQWTDVQKRKGLPSWMLEEHENAKKKREEALKKRKDANLKHVIISEKLDKKAEKLHTKTLPYPYTSKEVFNQSIRMPIGPEFNPVTTIGALNRPEVVKKAGVIIKPIKYEDVNPHDRTDNKRGVQKQKSGQTSSKDLKKKKKNTKEMND